MRKLLLPLLICASIFLQNISILFAQDDLASKFQKVDSLFSKWAKPNSPGASIGIYKDGELIYTQGYGMGNLEYDIPIKPNSIFHVASISKQFTDFALLLLEEEGKVSLDDDIRKYLPEIHDFGTKITIRHLMHHTSGFRDQWQLLVIAGWRMDDVITKSQIMKMIKGQRELNFEPGTEYRYCNSGYSILARIVEKVSGKTYQDFAKKRIFKPLEMNDSHIHDDHEHIVPRRTYSYYPKGLGYKKGVLSYANDGATSLFTTAEDMGKWIHNMLHPKLGANFIPKMREKGKLNNGEEINYGLGQSVGTYKGLNYAGHGGADAGFRSMVRWFPQQDFGVVVMSNLATFNAGELTDQITDIFLKEQFIIEEKPKKEYKLIDLSPKELEKFTGKYTIPQFGVNLSLAVKEDSLEVHQEWNNLRFKVVPIAQDTFVELEDEGVKLAFAMNKGKVDGLLLLQGSQRYIAEKYVEYEVNPEKLEVFVGKYHCPETDSYYGIALTEEGLIATHNRHVNSGLKQIGDYSFRGSTWWMRNISFVQDKQGNIEAMLIGGGRVENLRFNKVK